MFFAFAALYPNTQFLIYFIPVKVKYLAYISGAFIYIIYIISLRSDFIFGVIPILVSLANFLIFFLQAGITEVFLQGKLKEGQDFAGR